MEKRTYTAADQTKQALAVALKELMAQKPVNKITIHDITERCGIRRQNFYYHFEDVYDLMRWMFQEVEESEIQPEPAGAEVEEATPPDVENQPFNPEPTPKNQPVSTDYIEYLKGQVAELKAEKARTEERLNATIQEKDRIINSQSAQLAELAKQVAQIADRALIATSQQQVLTAMEKGERADTGTAEEQIVPIEPAVKPKKSFWSRFFGD